MRKVVRIVYIEPYLNISLVIHGGQCTIKKAYFVPNLPPFLAHFNQNYKKNAKTYRTSYK